MQSPHAMVAFLQMRRRETAEIFGDRPIGVASCQVLDELIRRAQVLADQHAEDAPVNLNALRQLPSVLGTITQTLSTLNAMNEMQLEGMDAAGLQHGKLLQFIERVRSEGYKVADDLTMTDAHSWTALDGTDDPEILVQLEAEKIARAEQTTTYQNRITRMAAAIEDTENEYAQRVRELIPVVPDG